MDVGFVRIIHPKFDSPGPGITSPLAAAESIKKVFKKITEILQKDISAKEKDDARQTFFQLTALVRNWNSSEWEGEDFKKYEEQINEFLGS